MHPRHVYLLRHAKAESANSKHLDEDRALTVRGVDDAKKLASKLIKKGIVFDLILTSPAIRAITTAQIIAHKIDYQQRHLKVEKRLYQANPDHFLMILTKLHKKIKKILIVAHNPGLEEFSEMLAGESVSMQTCSLVEFSFDLKDWKDLDKIHTVELTILN